MQIKFLTVTAIFVFAAAFVHASPLVKRITPEEDAQKARLEYVQKDPALQQILEYEVEVIVADLNKYDEMMTAGKGGESSTASDTTAITSKNTSAPPPGANGTDDSTAGK